MAVLLGIATGGAAVLAYLIGWVAIPQADDDPTPRLEPRPTAEERGAREAWRAVGDDLRALADGLRTAGPAGTGAGSAAAPDAGQDPSKAQPAEQAGNPARRPVEAVDAAMTALGERLRDPEVKEGARRAAVGLSAAVTASIDELGRRTRRAEPPRPPSSNEPPRPPSSDGPTNGQG